MRGTRPVGVTHDDNDYVVDPEKCNFCLDCISPWMHVYLCGLRRMESGVEETFSTICRDVMVEWPTLRSDMRASGRYHVETY